MSKTRPFVSLFGIVILIVVALITLHSHAFASQSIIIHWHWMLIALLLDVSLCWLGSHGWLCILKELGVSEQAEDHLNNYWISQPFQFLGGVLGSTLGRLWLSKPLTIKNRTLAFALFIEKGLVAFANLLSISTLTILAFALEGKNDIYFIFNTILISISIAGMLFFLAKRPPLTPIKMGKTRIVIIYLVCVQSLGILSLFALTKALDVSSPLDVTLTSRTYLVSWFMGQIAFFVPQGLGIREVVFAFLMHTPAGIRWPISYVLWARLLSIGGQLIPILILSRHKRLDRHH